MHDPRLIRRQHLVALLVAVAFALGWHLWSGDALFDPADEGYLFYGVWRTSLGELPIRDFQSYDPGRYLAAAALEKLLGSGFLGLRRSIAVFHGLGILFGLLCARRATRRAWPLVPIGILLGLWMFPRHKVFEGVLALATTWVGVRLLERPTRGRHVAAGACIGLTGFFGRNLGLYSALGLAVLALINAWRRRKEEGQRPLADGAALAGGIALGYAPILPLLLAPGFAPKLLESVLLVKRLGFNLPSPWLWPWDVELAGRDAFATVAMVGVALAYLLPVIVLPIGCVLALTTRAEDLSRRALFLSASVVGAFYIHHAAVRSGLLHLAQAIEPTLLATVAGGVLWSARQPRLALTTLWLGASLVAVGALRFNSGLSLDGPELVPLQLGEDTVRVPPNMKRYVETTLGVLRRHVKAGERVFLAPARPGLYPLVDRRSPSWWIYFFVPEPDETVQRRLLEELAGVEWVLIVDSPIAGREDLLFENSHPLVWEHIRRAYERVPAPEIEPYQFLFRLRADGGRR